MKKINKMMEVMAILSGIMIAFNSNAQTCTPSPACAELGYNKILSDCPDNAVKCPWDNSKVFCNKPEIGRGACAVGWIYYTDGSCVKPDKHDNSKKALGVVVYVNVDGGGQVITAKPVGKYMWSTEYARIPSLMNDGGDRSASKDINSCSNTAAMIAAGPSSKYPAAYAVRNYSPDVASYTKGKWCIPAAGVMVDATSNLAIQAGIAKLGGKQFENIWLSTMKNGNEAWCTSKENIVNAFSLSPANKDWPYDIYAVLEF